jgi:hypothetical protein
LIIANLYEAEVARRAVEKAGLRAVVSDGSEKVLELYEKESPSLVVLALGLFAGDSVEVLSGLRGVGGPRVPLMVIGDPLGEDEESHAARVFGVDRWLPRPVDGEALRRALFELAEAGLGGGDDDLNLAVDEIYESVSRPEGAAFEAYEEYGLYRKVDPALPGGPAPGAPAGFPAAEPRPPAMRPGTPASGVAVMATPGLAAPARAASGGERWILRVDDAIRDPLGPIHLDSGAAAGSPRRGASEDALGDIDLDRLGVDALPGIDTELGTEVPRGQKSQPRPTPRPMRPTPAPLPVSTGASIGVVIPARARQESPGRGGPGRVTPPPRPEMRRPTPAPPYVESLAPAVPELPDAGELTEIGLAALIGRLYRAGFTGRLSLRSDTGERVIYFDGGFAVAATSTLTNDGLGEFLWREGRVTRAELTRYREALQAAGNTGNGGLARGERVAETLVSLGLLPRAELPAALRRYTEELIYASFAWESGRYGLGPETAPPDRRVHAGHPYALVTEGVRRKLGLDRLVERVGAPTTVLHALPLLETVAVAAALEPAESAAVLLLHRAPQSVAELAQAARLDERACYALVYALIELGSLRVGQVVAVAQQQRDRDRVLAKLALVNDGDYFAILGLTRDATGYEIRRAWEQSRRDFTAERLTPELRTELATPLTEITEVLDEAYRVLSDDRVRESYRAHLPQ